MNSQNGLREEFLPASDAWAASERTKSHSKRNGTVWGALSGFALMANADLQCRILKNSEGCGAQSLGEVIVIPILLTSVAGFPDGQRLVNEGE
ncbi:MAG: hypothetical protein KY445_15545 [Armatimonadetes bacterium]|nr:hypothetical protein [Armatimonadota bacterium]